MSWHNYFCFLVTHELTFTSEGLWSTPSKTLRGVSIVLPVDVSGLQSREQLMKQIKDLSENVQEEVRLRILPHLLSK